MTKPKLRKNAEINPSQSPHDGIHTCSKGCSKPGCTRTLRDTIEEQDKQIEALKRDVLEKTAELRKSEEHNDALCERMQDLNSELFAASNINGKLHMKRVHDLNQMGGQCEEIARLKAEIERLTKQNALATPRHLIASQDIKTLREQIDELKLENSQYEEHHKYGQNVITSLREEVERLTKAVMHSPAAQLKLKELEGKTTFDEINPDNQ